MRWALVWVIFAIGNARVVSLVPVRVLKRIQSKDTREEAAFRGTNCPRSLFGFRDSFAQLGVQPDFLSSRRLHLREQWVNGFRRPSREAHFK